jgi:uncharacterized protein
MDTYSLQREQSRVVVNSFIRSTYNWMAFGLALTGIVALYVSSSNTMLNLLFNMVDGYAKPSMLFYGLIIAELIVVFSLASRVQRMQSQTATAMFLIYAILNGATLSAIFLGYTGTTIASAFFICAAMFIACSIYGMSTKRDLTGLGQFMFMGFIGIFIVTLVNIFMNSYGLQMLISYVGVVVFVGLTAYDTQKLKQMALAQPDDLDAGTIRKGAIMGALTLYLDFILMFQFLLMILGGRRG